MATNGAEYELVLMLDPEAADERRDQIAADARGRIESGGTLKADKAWGMRKLAYEIRQRTEADYRFFRFETQRALLDDLDHSLKITDGVLRFRIFKVDPAAPVIEPPPPVALAGAASGRGSGAGGRRGSGARPPREEPAEAAPATETPAAEAPQPEAPAPEAPPAEAPPAEAPPAEAPPAEEPPAEAPPADEPPADEPPAPPRPAE